MDVKTICLGVLCTREATGYDIKKHFETAFSHFFLAGFGSIYPALAELSDAGLVSCEERSSGGRPGRKVYRATEAGRASVGWALARHDVGELFSLILPENGPSAAVAERLGFSIVETRVVSHFPDAPHDIWRLTRS